jgi:hypothetical protein
MVTEGYQNETIATRLSSSPAGLKSHVTQPQLVEALQNTDGLIPPRIEQSKPEGVSAEQHFVP